MNKEDVDRIEELEELLEIEGELDEDDREELRYLRSIRREENSRAKSLKQFEKAKRVYRVADSDSVDGYIYALKADVFRSMLFEEDWKDIEEVDKPEITGNLRINVDVAKVFWFEEGES